MVPEIDQGVAMRIGGDERLQLLDRLSIGGLIELDGVLLRIAVRQGLGADARSEHEMVTAGTANRY